MDLIEVLWKQDVDLGFTLVDPSPPTKSGVGTSSSNEDDIEKLKTLEAINAADDKVLASLIQIVAFVTSTYANFDLILNRDYPRKNAETRNFFSNEITRIC